MRDRAAQRRAQEQARREQPIEVGTAAGPARVHNVHNKTAYMYVPPHRSIGHTHKITPNGEGRSATGE
jgi:hypothetical protein